MPRLRSTDPSDFEPAFPNHRTTVLERTGHFLQEDAPEELAAAIAGWYPDLRSGGGGRGGSPGSAKG